MTTTIHELNALEDSVKEEILALTAPWYASPPGQKKWRFTMYGARALLLKPSARADICYAALARDAGSLVGWTVVAVRSGEHTIVNAYVAPSHRGQGIADEMIAMIKERATGPLAFQSYNVASDGVAARHGLALKQRGHRGRPRRRGRGQ